MLRRKTSWPCVYNQKFCLISETTEVHWKLWQLCSPVPFHLFSCSNLINMWQTICWHSNATGILNNTNDRVIVYYLAMINHNRLIYESLPSIIDFENLLKLCSKSQLSQVSHESRMICVGVLNTDACLEEPLIEEQSHMLSIGLIGRFCWRMKDGLSSLLWNKIY